MTMARRDLALIVVLSLIWGASFMFIKVADRSFDPSALVWLRLLLGCAAWRKGRWITRSFAARQYWWRIALLGFANTGAVPADLVGGDSARGFFRFCFFAAFFLIFKGKHDAQSDRCPPWRARGFSPGVGLQIGSAKRGWRSCGTPPVVLAALGYATGASLGAHLASNVQPIVVGTVSTAIAAILVTPLGVSRLPSSVPGWKEDWSLVALGVVGTGLAYILAYELLRSAGASRTILITYLIPGVALLYGVVLLGEPLRWIAVAGLVLILAGVALAGRRRSVGLRRAALPPHDVPHHRPGAEPDVL